MYTFPPNLTRVTTLPGTLLNADVLHFYLTLDLLQLDCSNLVSKWTGHTVATTFLLRDHCRHAHVPGRVFFVSPQLIKTMTLSLSWSERDMQYVLWSKHFCSCMRDIFRAQILTILSRSVMTSWQLITLLNKPHFNLLCANSVVR